MGPGHRWFTPLMCLTSLGRQLSASEAGPPWQHPESTPVNLALISKPVIITGHINQSTQTMILHVGRGSLKNDLGYSVY